MEKKYRERIERYLDGLLSDEEKGAFEQELLVNTELSDAFEAYLRDSNVLAEGETSTSADLLAEAETERKGTAQEIEPSEEIHFEVNKETNGNKEVLTEDLNKKTVEGADWTPYLRPIAIFLLGLSFYFFIKNSCNDKPQLPDILTQQGNASPLVEEEMASEGESILEDISERPKDIIPENEELGVDTVASNSFAPPPPTEDEEADCFKRIKEADRYYKKGKYEEAQVPLAIIVQTENSACQADAWYYLGLIRLKLGDPQSALQCLGKVDNLEKYGQDVQWYMALAFYEMAQTEYEFRPRAKRAFEQQLNAQESEDRKLKAKSIIEELQ